MTTGGGGGGSGTGAGAAGAFDVASFEPEGFDAAPAGALPLSGVEEDLLPHPATVSKKEIATTRATKVVRMGGSRGEVLEEIQRNSAGPF
jgi:hypothetical protein